MIVQLDDIMNMHRQPMSATGLTHRHERLVGKGKLLRIPIGKNELGLPPLDYLQQQEACYNAAYPSGHTPQCYGIISPSEQLPFGALIIEEISNARLPQLPQDWPKLASALAALHSIKPCADDDMLYSAEYPFATQMLLPGGDYDNLLRRLVLPHEAKYILGVALDKTQENICKLSKSKLPCRLIGGDAHPANFLIDPNGKAWFVDLEWVGFDVPLIDLGDCRLPITQRMEPDIVSCGQKDWQQVFTRTWYQHADAELRQTADQLLPLSDDIVRLRSLAWLAGWSDRRVEKAGKISEKSLRNWDQMAASYLEPRNLVRYLKTGYDPVMPARPWARHIAP